ncbi:MAG: T9SS type A sorting domain-containing protein, partial [Chloroherpetonaceae bacterium]
KFGQTICRDIMIHNSSAKDVEINDIMIAKNLDFSIPQSQYPMVVPALDSVSIQVCFSAKYPLYGTYRDTLTYFENCVFAQTALVAEIDSAAYDGISRCEVVIKIRSNYDSLGDSEPLIYPNPTRGIVWLNSNNSRDDLSLEVYNILGEQVKSMLIEAKSLPNQIDLRDMNDGNYVIIIHQNNLLSVKKILLLQ